MALGFDKKDDLVLLFLKYLTSPTQPTKCKISYVFVKEQRTKTGVFHEAEHQAFSTTTAESGVIQTTTLTIDVHGNLQEHPKCSMFTANFWVAQLFGSQM